MASTHGGSCVELSSLLLQCTVGVGLLAGLVKTCINTERSVGSEPNLN